MSTKIFYKTPKILENQMITENEKYGKKAIEMMPRGNLLSKRALRHFYGAIIRNPELAGFSGKEFDLLLFKTLALAKNAQKFGKYFLNEDLEKTWFGKSSVTQSTDDFFLFGTEDFPIFVAQNIFDAERQQFCSDYSKKGSFWHYDEKLSAYAARACGPIPYPLAPAVYLNFAHPTFAEKKFETAGVKVRGCKEFCTFRRDGHGKLFFNKKQFTLAPHAYIISFVESFFRFWGLGESQKLGGL